MDKTYYIPELLNLWPAAIDPLTREQSTVGEAVGRPLSIGYIPAYATLTALRVECGNVPYITIVHTEANEAANE